MEIASIFLRFEKTKKKGNLSQDCLINSLFLHLLPFTLGGSTSAEPMASLSAGNTKKL